MNSHPAGPWVHALEDARTCHQSVVVLEGNLWDLADTGEKTPDGGADYKPILARYGVESSGDKELLSPLLLSLGFDAVVRIPADPSDGVQIVPDFQKGRIPPFDLPEHASPEDLAIHEARYMRSLVVQDEIPLEKRLNVAVIKEYSHVAFGADDHARPFQKQYEAIVHQAALGAAIVNGKRNTLFFILGRSQDFPWRMLAGCPDVARIEVRLPSQEAREHWLEQPMVKEAVLAHVPKADQERIFRALVAGSDGMRIGELFQVVRHVSSESGGCTNPIDALRRVKFGRPVSFWGGFSKDPERRYAVWDRLRTRLQEEIIGQPKATERVCQIVGTALVHGDSVVRKGPRGVILLVGPTGVGKTETCKVLAKHLFGDEAAMARFNMAEYSDEQSITRLTGAGSGYVGYENGSEIVRVLRQRPECVILFDEVEKAHPQVWLTLMNLFEAGEISDAVHGKAYASDAIIVLTSNIGIAELQNPDPRAMSYEELTGFFEAQVKRFLSASPSEGGLGHPELWGRLQMATVGFDILREDFVPQVVAKFRTAFESDQTQLGYPVTLDPDSTLAWARNSLDPATGARGVATLFGGRLTLATADHLLVAKKSLGTTTSITFENAKPVFN